MRTHAKWPAVPCTSQPPSSQNRTTEWTTEVSLDGHLTRYEMRWKTVPAKDAFSCTSKVNNHKWTQYTVGQILQKFINICRNCSKMKICEIFTYHSVLGICQLPVRGWTVLIRTCINWSTNSLARWRQFASESLPILMRLRIFSDWHCLTDHPAVKWWSSQSRISS